MGIMLNAQIAHYPLTLGHKDSKLHGNPKKRVRFDA
jgi:hypothetical protein